jgi:acetyl esterase/lipase
MRDSMPAELLELMKPTMGGSGEIPTAPDPLPTWEENAAQAASGPMFKMREAMGPPFSDDATLASLVELGEGIDISAHTTTGVDGNEIVLDFFRPTDAQGDIPCIYYIHGGGMASMSMRLNNFQQFARLVARQGVAVCLVEFRNSVVRTEAAPTIAPFPAGLNDCMTGLEWLDANRK